MLDLIDAIRDAGGADNAFEPEFAPARLGEIERSCLAVGKARDVLGWQAVDERPRGHRPDARRGGRAARRERPALADHGRHRPGRLLPGRAPARAGPRRRRARAPAGRARAPGAGRGAARRHRARRRRRRRPRRAAPRRCARRGPTGSTTSPRRRSCPRRGTTPPGRCATIAEATATVLELARELDLRVVVAVLAGDLRRRRRQPAGRGQPQAAALALRRRQARRARARRASCARARRARVLGHHLQPRVAAPARALRDAQDHPRRGGDPARAASDELALGDLERAARLVARARRRARASRSRSTTTSRATTSWPAASARTVGDFVDGGVRRGGRRSGGPRARRPAVRAPARAHRCSSATPSRAREILGWEPQVSFERARARDGRGRPAPRLDQSRPAERADRLRVRRRSRPMRGACRARSAHRPRRSSPLLVRC